MGLLVWLLGLCSNLLVVVLCLLVIVIIVTLDAAAEASTWKKENVDRKKKNGVEEAKGSKKAGEAKKSRKEKRVKFMDDVVLVRKSNDVKGVELCLGTPEKAGFLANSSEGRLIVGREDGCNLMEDVDDVVVVGSVNHFDDSNKPAEDFGAAGEISVKDECVERWLEEGLEVTRNEGDKIGVDEKSEVMFDGEKSVGGCDEVNETKDVERADGQAEAEVAEENSEIIGYCGVKARDAVTSSSEEFPEIDMVSSEDRLESMNDDDRVEKCSDAAAGERVANNKKVLEKELQVSCLDDKNVLKLTSEDVAIDDIDANITGRVANDPELLEEEIGRHTVLDEDRVSLMNNDIMTDERMAENGHLEGELDEEAVESQKGITVSGMVAINENNVAAREIGTGKSECSEEEMERDAVEEQSDKFSGGEEGKIPLWTNEFENMIFEEEKKYEKSHNESNVELITDNVAGPLIVAGRVVHEEEGVVRDEEVHDNCDHEDGDDDDDWEGVERSHLEKVFAEAVNYVAYEWKLKYDWSANSRGNIPKRLYGLHKLAIQGPCNVPPPMALKVTARAKWNAWQSLGNMSPEVAMEEYIKILSDADPGWMRDSVAMSSSVNMKLFSNTKWSFPSHLTLSCRKVICDNL